MVYLIIAVLTIATVYLLVRLLSLKKALKGAGKQLKEINRELEENRIVKLAVPDKDAEELLTVINESLQAIREHKNIYAKREKVLKQQIENISHDLRTPLTSMLGYLRLMETGGLCPEEKEDLQTVIRKAERLQELITQFYEYTKVTSSDYSLILESIEVTKLLREALADAYPELEKRRLEVDVQMPQTPVMLRGNVNAMQRVFQNLLQNAARYAKSCLEVAVSEKGGEVEITFTNDVEDLNVSDVNRLFERFYTPDASRTQGATGLGLTIAKEFVEKMQGTMEAELVGKKLRMVMRFEK